VLLFGGGFAVPSETAFKPLPLCLVGALIYIKNKTA